MYRVTIPKASSQSYSFTFYKKNDQLIQNRLCSEIEILYSCGYVAYLAYIHAGTESLVRGGPTLTAFF